MSIRKLKLVNGSLKIVPPNEDKSYKSTHYFIHTCMIVPFDKSNDRVSVPHLAPPVSLIDE